MDTSDAEAGPSQPRPKPLVPTRPIPDPPPATPPSTSKSVKRRSWFGLGLGSPSIITGSSSSNDTASPTKKDRRRSTSSIRSNREEVHLEKVVSNEKGKGRESFEEDRHGKDEEELLTIDGDPEKTVKKKKRKSKGENEEFEVMRMQDLGGSGSNQQTPRSTSERTVKVNMDGEETPTLIKPHQFHPQPSLIRQRTFSRTASDRDPFSPPDPSSIPPKTATPRSSSSSLKNHQRPDIHPRTSSRPSSSYSPSARVLSLQIDKSQPPIPVDFDRPLPPLPSKNSSSSMKPPELPRGIVVTPSSPRKLSKTPKKPLLTQRRSRSATGHSRVPPIPSTQSKRSHSNSPNPNTTPVAGSRIGLGLPSALLPSSRPNTESPPPPPVPSKPQSVSSPFPSRTPSPIPKIAFVEPDGLPEKPDESPQQQEEKRKVVRRARSLSGFFGRSPPIPQNAKMEEPLPAPEQSNSGLSESASKSGGVLEWLGVRKTVRRKTSEAQMKAQGGDGTLPGDGPGDITAEQQTQGHSRESLEPPRNGDSIPGSQQPTPRRSQQKLSPSTAAPLPAPGPSKISSIFTRRSSARTTDDESEPLSVQVVPMAIPNAGMRNITAQSSESSLNLPAHDPISPFIPGSGPWVSTPQSEKEEAEVLFSTPEAEGSNWGPGRRPWMDGAERHNSSRSSISSPLDPLPEQSLPPTQAPLKAPPTFREGRVRSWSDAPLPPQKLVPQSSNPHLPLPRPTTPNSQSPSLSLSASPRTPSRPKLGERSNSGNSAILGRMKSVFSKSTNRSRSSSLLGKGTYNSGAEIDEFGNIPSGPAGEMGRSQRMRPSTSSSSMASSGAFRGRSIGDDNVRPGPGGAEEQTRSPRTSFTPSIASLGSGSNTQETKAQRKNRVRASTISLAPTAYHFAPPRPSSPNLFPIAATPPRRRPGTIHRISNGLFGSGSSGPSSPKTSSSLFPLPARSSGSMSSSTGVVGWEDTSGSNTNGFLSPGTSPRPSTGSITAMSNSMIKQVSQRQDEETPKAWLDRVVDSVSRDEIANVLASSGDDFHTEALQLYLSTFDFTHNALDVALRRLLMHMSLPKETQQIDRVIEAFSKRYEECEPGLFGHKDNTYVLAFSMMMLHTDAFNKSNKNKMTKVDYVRNTRMEGVSPIVLEAFFDNITYTPFVFIEDDTDLKRSSGYESSSSTFGPSTPNFNHIALPSSVASTTPMPSGKAKIDVYHMIIRGLLGTLRVNVENQISVDNPFSYLGTRPFLNLDQLCQAFANANNLIIPSYIAAPSMKVAGKLTTPSRRNTVGARDQKLEDLVLRVVKVGLLSRKDESDQSSKKASRKWKSWSVILTSSQLLFFKDPTWALTLLEQIQSLQDTDNKSGQLLLPRQTTFKPDEVFSLKDCVAVYDRTFSAYPNTFRFVMPQSRQYLLQSSDEYEMNEWISLMNYASTFKTVNLKMKGPTMRKDQVVLAGAAAAASHKRELRAEGGNATPGGSGRKAFFGLIDITNANSSMSSGKVKVRNGNGNVNVDVDEPNQVVHEGEQLEEVFGVVKAELAAGRGEAGSNRPSTSSEMVQEKEVVREKRHVHTSRVSLIYDHLNTLRQKCLPIESSLSSSLLLTRNISLLTPFQRSTRDKISSSIPSLAHKIRNDRLNLTKLKLWIRVLEHEGEREDREWKVVRHVALQAAARSLREDTVVGVVKDVNRQSGETEREVPKLEIPDGPSSSSPPPLSPSPISHSVDGEEASRSGRSEVTSPVELPEMIRRSSDEPPTSDTDANSEERRKPSTSDQLNRSTLNNQSNGMRKSNSANDLLNPKYHVQFRRSSEIEETHSQLKSDGFSPHPERGGIDLTHSPNLSVSDNDRDRAGTDTPMMMFSMESPLEVPEARMADPEEGGKTEERR
uniref:SEC7 domain-containing protein n=1 Tax=Kwoniella bestiolae CBS 10118 TaxID=1296100 RepID=A0A1B9GG36_9TREE|nr:hypothetical protein I302_01532 [Kwoniella bestiolae CBS 10118]OCF30014.1 hypothetical protein I302_01532 [Kwoniella bestiolae CBS 10118]